MPPTPEAADLVSPPPRRHLAELASGVRAGLARAWRFLGEAGPPFRAEVAPVAYAWAAIAVWLTADLVRGPRAPAPLLGVVVGGCCVLAWRVAWQKGRDPVAWACTCLVTFGAGLVILLARRPARMREGHYRPCASCGEFNRWKAQACASCGGPVVAEESARRALDLSGPVYDAWLLGLFPWYGVVFGLVGVFLVPLGTWAGTLAGGCFTAAFWAAAWGLPRRSTAAAGAILGLIAAGLASTGVFLAGPHDGEALQLLLSAAVVAWPAARASSAVLQPRSEDAAARHCFAPWQQLSQHPPPGLAAPAARVPTDWRADRPGVAQWRGIAILLGLLILFVTREKGAAALFPLTAWAWRRGTRLSTLRADELRERDGRRPVLYFRSFRDEALNVDPGAFDAFQIAPRTLEMVMAGVAWHCGPVVAIGRPGEEDLPPLGFAREFVSQDEWRLTATEWMSEARLMFVVAGPTAGVAWEMNALAAAGALERVVVVIPPVHPDELRGRWTAFLDHLDASVRARLARVNVDRALAVVFAREGEARSFTAARRGFRAYEVALQAAVGYVLAAGGDLDPATPPPPPDHGMGPVPHGEPQTPFPDAPR